LTIERLNDLGSDQLLGRDIEPVGVALNGVEQPGSRVADFSQQRGGRGRCVIAGEDLLQDLGRVRGATVSGRMMLCGSPSPTT
jgi:hypothetical protein